MTLSGSECYLLEPEPTILTKQENSLCAGSELSAKKQNSYFMKLRFESDNILSLDIYFNLKNFLQQFLTLLSRFLSFEQILLHYYMGPVLVVMAVVTGGRQQISLFM